MLKNYFKIAWRNLWNTKAFSAINILGLSIGIAFAMLISGYVWSELQVNKQLKNPHRQYILQSIWKDPSMGLELTTLGPLAKVLKEQYPNLIANYCRWDGIGSIVLKGDKTFREGLQLCDSTMLGMYGFKLMHGDAKTALNGSFTTVISTDIAIKYFGKTDVVGETLSIESFSGSKHDFVVNGVLANPARNSVTYINEDNNNQIYIPLSSVSFFGRYLEVWNNPYIVSYVELKRGVTPKDLEKPIAQLIKQNTPVQIQKNLRVQVVPLTEYYLNADKGLVRKMLYTLSCTAFFILLMAVINFINITVSRSSTRMKEIGVRKVMGGLRKQLIIQFLAESILLVVIATALAMLVYLVSRHYLSDILGKEIPHLFSYPVYYILIPIIFAIITGSLAGLYPAFLLSSLKSVDSLKGKLKMVKENVLLRKSLVGFQFFTALVVFIGALVVSKQVELFFSKDLGYNKDFIISAQAPRDWSEKGVRRMETIRDEFAAMPEIVEVSLSYEIPNGNNARNIRMYKASVDSTQAIMTHLLYADENYAAAYSIPVTAGTFLKTENNSYDLSKIVINETQVKALGWKDGVEAIGKQVKMEGDPTLYTIAGVTKDFHFDSMHKAIQPITFMHIKQARAYRYLSFKVKPGNTAETIAALQKKWQELLPGTAFEYTFMDDTLKKLYYSEIQLKKASETATVLTLIIVLLGVLSLISLSIQNRTKEIGIRKVLGASVPSILTLFIKEFTTVILIAGLIACPIAYLVMQSWLNDYVYRIALTGQPFLIAFMGLSLITALLIILQTIKAALANPVKNLRTE
jgi:putative ABC transport system permease protein